MSRQGGGNGEALTRSGQKTEQRREEGTPVEETHLYDPCMRRGELSDTRTGTNSSRTATHIPTCQSKAKGQQEGKQSDRQSSATGAKRDIKHIPGYAVAPRMNPS